MCGIVSVLSFDNDISEKLIGALERLEYRGYDSAGMAFINQDSKIFRIRSVGKIEELKKKIENLNNVKKNTNTKK